MLFLLSLCLNSLYEFTFHTLETVACKMNIYIIYLLVWIGLVVLLFLLFKYFPAKMRSTENIGAKNSLFTILMLISIPFILIVVISPIIIIGGDENMPSSYKYFFTFVVLAAIVMFLLLKRKKPEDTNISL
jgi:hypothetical protein